MGDPIGVVIANAMLNNQSITALNLDGNEIADASLHVIGEHLKTILRVGTNVGWKEIAGFFEAAKDATADAMMKVHDGAILAGKKFKADKRKWNHKAKKGSFEAAFFEKTLLEIRVRCKRFAFTELMSASLRQTSLTNAETNVSEPTINTVRMLLPTELGSAAKEVSFLRERSERKEEPGRSICDRGELRTSEASAMEVLFCGESGLFRSGVVGGIPPEPPQRPARERSEHKEDGCLRDEWVAGGLSAGDPPNPPCSAAHALGRACPLAPPARPHMRSAAHAPSLPPRPCCPMLLAQMSYLEAATAIAASVSLPPDLLVRRSAPTLIHPLWTRA
jgi:hypothetical protein